MNVVIYHKWRYNGNVLNEMWLWYDKKLMLVKIIFPSEIPIFLGPAVILNKNNSNAI